VLDGAEHRVRALILTLGTKKRRIVSIVVLWNQSVLQRLMFIDYQIRLDLAPGAVLLDVDEWARQWCLDKEIERDWHFCTRLWFTGRSSPFCKCVILSMHIASLCGRIRRYAPTQRISTRRRHIAHR
jgi:hypothetical protein